MSGKRVSKDMLSWSGRVCRAFEDGKKQGAVDSLIEIENRIKFQTENIGFATPKIAVETMLRIIEIYKKELEAIK